MREITIGQYYMADSPIHRLDPRVKLAATLGYMITLLFQKNFPAYLLAGDAPIVSSLSPLALQHGHTGDSPSFTSKTSPHNLHLY